MPRLLAVALTAAAVTWMAAVLSVPFLSVRGTSPVLVAMVRSTGAFVCHQRLDRSFHVHGAPLPVCARCTGLYVSGALGAIAGWVGLTRIPRRTRILLAVAAVPTAISFAAESAGIAAPSNLVRAVAAAPLGAAAGWLFVRMLRAESAPTTCAMIS